jgi:Adenine specific DNA methylase Mod
VTRQKKNQAADTPVEDYRYDATRKNNPPAGLAAQGKLREVSKIQYTYNPHLPPVLRFDDTGSADNLPELLQTARERKLTSEEVNILANALRNHEPWLEWAGKREAKKFVVDPVALHIHERNSARAIVELAKREDMRSGLFDDEVRGMYADPQQPYREAVQFYEHDVEWSNRMILGDSLQVMASLARREDLAGKVQMVYLDPPYGIRFASNFQPEIGKRDVKDRDSDLTREPEMVKAYRDTWTLGVHSYLTYLRDRLILSRELLNDSGSIFVQISDENLHRVRAVLDEVFGAENQIATICYKKPGQRSSTTLNVLTDFILWYARDKDNLKCKKLYVEKSLAGAGGDHYISVELHDGTIRPLKESERFNPKSLPDQAQVFETTSLYSAGWTETGSKPFNFNGKTYTCGSQQHWSASEEGRRRLANSERIVGAGKSIRYKRYFHDFAVMEIDNRWDDIGIFGQNLYVVQTSPAAIERCILLTTDPGDLVIDPTCGSGTTAYIAEQWGRRWITIDSSRVALAIARQRLLTATYLFYKIKDNNEQNSSGRNNPASGFIYKFAPRITLKSIAQNVALDSIFAKHQLILDEKLTALNAALRAVTPSLRTKLLTKLADKQKQEGKRAVTESERRRWILPQGEWKEWEVPFDVDENWTPELKSTLQQYRVAWRAKMDEINACIAANAENVALVDQPESLRGIVRVSGAFTMEAVMPAEESLDSYSLATNEPENLETFGKPPDYLSTIVDEPLNVGAYHDKMLRLLYVNGVRFLNNKTIKFTHLGPLSNGEFIHAEGEWETEDGKARKVAVSFGPQHGAVTAYQVENALRMAHRRGFDELVFAGFSFDAAAQAAIQDDPNPDVRCHTATISADVNMGDLLKESPNSQIFTVFGNPRTVLRRTDGLYEVEMQGVDIYNPVDNTISPTSADKVAAWFLDSDYDGRTFCITQAFFPDKAAWEKIARALKGTINEDFFSSLSGTTSLPFAPGKHKRAAVKVIDPRGNEVMSVHRLTDGGM